MTGHLVNKFLMDLLVAGLDHVVPCEQQLGLTVQRDERDHDSSMTGASDKGRSLRPDGQLRTSDGALLLFEWEEKAASVPLSEAEDDLRSKYLQPWCTTSPVVPIPPLCR